MQNIRNANPDKVFRKDTQLKVNKSDDKSGCLVFLKEISVKTNRNFF